MTGWHQGGVALTLAVIAFAGCQKDVKSGAEQPLVDQTIDTKVNIAVKGAVAINVDKPAKVRFVARKGSTTEMEASLVSVTTAEPVAVNDTGRFVMTEIAAVGTYSGQRKITILPTSGEARADTSTRERGIAKVTVLETSGQRGEKKYSLTDKPCTLIVEDKGKRGSADCPTLALPSGETVSFKMKWGT
jgi:hypothetical protein